MVIYFHSKRSLYLLQVGLYCTEAGMFAIRAIYKVAAMKDFLEAGNKVLESYAKFGAIPLDLVQLDSNNG